MRDDDPHDDDSFEELRPSKTRLKAQAHALQELGKALAELPVSRLDALDMPEGLRDAITEYRRTKSHEGRRRQLQFVGKQMRGVDEAPLREAVAAFQLGSAQDTLTLHERERWRDELLADDGALTRWAAEHPGADLQRLRALLRQARREALPTPQDIAHGQAPRRGKAYRELFQFLREADSPDLVPDDDTDLPDPNQP